MRDGLPDQLTPFLCATSIYIEIGQIDGPVLAGEVTVEPARPFPVAVSG
jgi:hypothetical protein